jgi:hypothetical protein
MQRSVWVSSCLAILAVMSSGGRVDAQSPSGRPTVLVADLTFYGAKANSIEPGDSAIAQVATTHLRAALHDSTFALIDSARAAMELSAADRPGLRCNASIECVRRVGQRLGARWAVMGTVSKISNLIWYLSGQVIDVATGKLILDDGFELKGPRDEMIPRGATSLARRVERAMGGENLNPRLSAPQR